MSEITTIGLDPAKHVFQVHGIDAQGTTVLRKRLRRGLRAHKLLQFFYRNQTHEALRTSMACVRPLDLHMTENFFYRSR